MELFVTLLICALVFFSGVSFGWALREKAAERIVKNLMKEIEDLPEEDENFINIIIEKHSGTYYVFDKADNSFMAQAPNRTDLEKVLERDSLESVSWLTVLT